VVFEIGSEKVFGWCKSFEVGIEAVLCEYMEGDVSIAASDVLGQPQALGYAKTVVERPMSEHYRPLLITNRESCLVETRQPPIAKVVRWGLR
jgi:hypothetical protein